MSKTLSSFWPFAVAFLLSASVRFYWISQKSGLGLDESLSVAYATCNSIGTTEKIPSGKFINGRQWRAMTWDIKNSLFHDLKTLWKDSRDGCLPNFYYILLRISLCGLQEISAEDIIFRSSILNFSLFVVSFIAYSLLLCRLMPGQKLLCAGILAIVYLSPGTLSYTLYVRSYQLQQLMFILTALAFVRAWERIQEPGGSPSFFSDILFPAMILSLAVLSGYYSLVFIVLLGFALIIFACKRREFRKISFLAATFFLSILLSLLLYPNFFIGFSTPPARCAYLSPTFLSPAYFWDRVCLFYRFITGNVLSIWALLLLIAIGVFAFVRRKYPCAKSAIPEQSPEGTLLQQNIMLLLLSGISLLWSMILVYASLFDTPRYFSPCIPLLFLAPACLLRALHPKKQAFFLLILLFLTGWQGLNSANIRYLHKDTGKEVAAFIQEPHIPVIFRIPTSSLSNNFTAFLSEEQYYILADDEIELQKVLERVNICYLQSYLRHNSDRKDFIKACQNSLDDWLVISSKETPTSDEAFPHASFMLLKLVRKRTSPNRK
ncbi:MAG: hypothetical protein GX927_03985 [Lentisphaerae bacterium]|nr:hypothetical protein [Lentisphaerota bacterium]